jgi:uncharacterized membrane protein YtjA (UPF0391 family)
LADVFGFVPSRSGFLRFFAPETRRNSGFQAGLFPHLGARTGSRADIETEVGTMLSWVVTLLIIALIAGVLGFGGLAGASIEIAKIIFFVAVVLFLVSAVVGLARGRSRV